MSFPARLLHMNELVSPLSDESGTPAALPPAVPGGRIFYSGFTLMEMLLVLFIMGLLASAATMMTGNLDTQARYDETRQRTEMVKRAIVGDHTRTVNGGPEVRGFVADMGRLPDCLRELLDGKCADADTVTLWANDANTGLWSGWNGPYLDVLGTPVFHDGWGNTGTAPNYGWNFAVDHANGTLLLQSYGSDGAAGGTDYAADYPASGNLLESEDHLIDLAGWNAVTVEFANATAGALPAADMSLRLRLYYPEDGDFPWPATAAERDAADYLSPVLTLAANSVAAGGNLEVVSGLNGGADIAVPWGARALAVVCDADGLPFDGNCDGTTSVQNTRYLTLVPRMSNPPLPPSAVSPLNWNIQ